MKRTIGGFLITTTRFEEINVTRKILNEKSLVYEEYGEEELDQEFSFEIMSDMTLDQIKELFDRIENEVKSNLTI